MQWIFAVSTLVVLIASSVRCEQTSNDDVNNQLTDTLANLPALEGLDISQLNLSQAPTIEDAERLFKEKCLKNANEAAFEHAKVAKDVVKECVLGLVNVTVLQEEMETAKPTGDLDIVFRKYCRKSPQLLDCIGNFTSAMEPCLDEAEKESKHLVQNITDTLVQFICFKEGDRIALFIAEGGPECLSSHQDNIQTCVNQTFSKHIPGNVPSINNLPSLVLGPEECDDLEALKKCIVNKLETCKEPTPANIVESMFNFVLKMTPCARLTKGTGRHGGPHASHSSGATGTSVALATVVVALVAAMLR